jgi:hypothetical protein
MNLGVPGVKADVMVIRFVEAALGANASAEDAMHLVTAPANELDADVIHLDHVIWKYGSEQSRGGGDFLVADIHPELRSGLQDIRGERH